MIPYYIGDTMIMVDSKSQGISGPIVDLLRKGMPARAKSASFMEKSEKVPEVSENSHTNNLGDKKSDESSSRIKNEQQSSPDLQNEEAPLHDKKNVSTEEIIKRIVGHIENEIKPEEEALRKNPEAAARSDFEIRKKLIMKQDKSSQTANTGNKRKGLRSFENVVERIRQGIKELEALEDKLDDIQRGIGNLFSARREIPRESFELLALIKKKNAERRQQQNQNIKTENTNKVPKKPEDYRPVVKEAPQNKERIKSVSARKEVNNNMKRKKETNVDEAEEDEDDMNYHKYLLEIMEYNNDLINKSRKNEKRKQNLKNTKTQPGKKFGDIESPFRNRDKTEEENNMHKKEAKTTLVYYQLPNKYKENKKQILEGLQSRADSQVIMDPIPVFINGQLQETNLSPNVDFMDKKTRFPSIFSRRSNIPIDLAPESKESINSETNDDTNYLDILQKYNKKFEKQAQSEESREIDRSSYKEASKSQITINSKPVTTDESDTNESKIDDKLADELVKNEKEQSEQIIKSEESIDDDRNDGEDNSSGVLSKLY